MPSIEDRIRRLEDRAEIQDLIIRYFLAADDDDYKTLADTFAPDGSFSASGFGTSNGRDAVVEGLRASRGFMGATVHTPHYVLITLEDEDHANGIVGAHLELAMGEDTLFGAVRYDDKYARVDGRWRFTSRQMRVVHVGPWKDVGNSLTAELRVRWPGLTPSQSDFPRKKHS
jgi:hypothetical protein